MQENAARYKEREAELVANMKEKGLDKYWITRDYDLQGLLNTDDIFRVGARGPQKTPMPFSDELFEKFRKMPNKKIIRAPKRLSNINKLRNENKLIYGTYFMAKDFCRPVIFAFTIVKNGDTKYANTDFILKLDMLVAGKEWLPLLRFDSLGSDHPNYIVDGKVVRDSDNVERISGPHIHLNNSATQVLTTDLSYTTAYKAPDYITKQIQSEDPQAFFKAALDYTLEMCGIPREMLSSQNPEYFLDFYTDLFDYKNK